MKKLSVLLVAAAVAVSASAGVNFKATHAMKSNRVINTEMTKLKANSLKAKADFRVVTAQPEGELKSYNRAGQYDYASNGYLYCGQQDGNRMDIVYGEDGKVYLKNILCGAASFFGTDSWVEGTIDGNVITVPLGQSIAYDEYYDAEILLCWGNTHGGEEANTIYFKQDERVTEITYLIDGETITLQETEGSTGGDSSNIEDYYGTGLSAYWSDDDSWTGFIEWNTVLTEREPVVTPTVITEIPATCEVETYCRNSSFIANSWLGIYNGTTDGKINIAFDTESDDVYVQNPSWWHDGYGTWVKGTIYRENRTIIIPTGQFLSWSDAYEYGIQLGWGSTYVYENGVDEETGETTYGMGYELDERTTEIALRFNEDGSFYLVGSEGDINAEFPYNYEATGMMTYYSDDMSFTAIEFANGEQPMGVVVNLVPAVPADPTNVSWNDLGDEDGNNSLSFTLPTTDVDGNMIDPEFLSYSVYIDKGAGAELFTFDAETYYYDLVEDMTEIPSSIYNGGYDFYADRVYFYRTFTGMENGFEPFFTHNIGIQAIYTVNGEKNASNIVWAFDPNTAVEEVNASKTVANVRYFNIAGQEMAQPQGMTIKVTTYTDGTSSAVKVVK